MCLRLPAAYILALLLQNVLLGKELCSFEVDVGGWGPALTFADGIQRGKDWFRLQTVVLARHFLQERPGYVPMSFSRKFKC